MKTEVEEISANRVAVPVLRVEGVVAAVLIVDREVNQVASVLGVEDHQVASDQTVAKGR